MATYRPTTEQADKIRLALLVAVQTGRGIDVLSAARGLLDAFALIAGASGPEAGTVTAEPPRPNSPLPTSSAVASAMAAATSATQAAASASSAALSSGFLGAPWTPADRPAAPK